MNRFLYRADADEKTGMGHFYRSLALARALSGFENFFAMQNMTPELKLVLEMHGIGALNLQSEGHFFELVTKEDIVVLDSYKFDESYRQKIKKKAQNLVVIDDLNEGFYDADIVINHGPHAIGYTYNCPKTTKLLLGSEFVLLRPAFLKYAGEGKVKDAVERITICIGGSDPKNLTKVILSAVSKISGDFIVNIVLGASNPHHPSDYIQEDSHDRIFIHRNLTEEKMVSLFIDSDLIISSASGTAMEVCTLNIPLVTICTAANQVPLSDFFKKQKLSLDITHAEEKSPEDIARHMEEILFNKTLREAITRQQQKYFDGKSGERLRREITSLVPLSIAGH